MSISQFRITRFQFARDRVIGDSQVRADDANVAALELISETGEIGLGFIQTLFHPLPDQAEIEAVFESEVWPMIKGNKAIGLVHRVNRPRGGNQRSFSLPFHEALQVALWDLAAKQAGMPLHQLLGSRRDRVRAYASGLDFHLSDEAFCALFSYASSIGYTAFKIKVGHPDFKRDLKRLDLLQESVPKGSLIMIDPNEAWNSKEALVKLTAIRDAGHDLLWVEDPILRHDFEGLRTLRHAVNWTQINSGEYLDLPGKRMLLENHGMDLLNVHGQVTDVMRIGWLAAEMGIPVSLGNTFLEVGVHMATALPEVEWLEYSFQNFDHLVETPVEIREGYAYAPDRPGHGLVLSEEARQEWARPIRLDRSQLGQAPKNNRLLIKQDLL
ncbi:L-alanine-DL-glutamate epimerase-like enolase superfamily enzyme [Phyllobacterium trifolii]|uniref:L-alanine-DL-glutamate epimerase-like enolase superfamily enzyme n=1 Tax=Phyllobacterium trifolii TaxID=300193 RepID=A0A839U6B0_9HYPH|nr:mandelate racemase/muconate lactonizing enzyme family protein [Phyllobacterium trifolii]MBB3146666.1 L-alanine-DL-glutamate epimerase-like enolase superfamily enzyme [Phyllobacterium trifolii]